MVDDDGAMGENADAQDDAKNDAGDVCVDGGVDAQTDANSMLHFHYFALCKPNKVPEFDLVS